MLCVGYFYKNRLSVFRRLLVLLFFMEVERCGWFGLLMGWLCSYAWDTNLIPTTRLQILTDVKIIFDKNFYFNSNLKLNLWDLKRSFWSDQRHKKLWQKANKNYWRHNLKKQMTRTTCLQCFLGGSGVGGETIMKRKKLKGNRWRRMYSKNEQKHQNISIRA